MCRGQSDVNTGASVSFAELESSMYKRRRLNQPALLTTVDGIISASRYATANDGPFYRGCVHVNVGTDGTASVFATSKQLSILSSAQSMLLTVLSLWYSGYFTNCLQYS